MNYRLFQYALPAPPELADLNAYLAGNRVAAVSHHIVPTPSGGMLVFVVETVAGSVPNQGLSAGPKIDYREQMNAEEFAVFSRLRSERKRMAEAEGMPVYTVFSNAQLAEMVKRRVRTAAELHDIEGIGGARIGKYGERLLAILAELPTPNPDRKQGEG